MSGISVPDMTYPNKDDNPQWRWKDEDGLMLGRPAFMIDPFVVILGSRIGGESRPPFTGLNMSLSGGDDEETVRRNRARMLARCGAVDRIAWAGQVHGTRVVRVDSPGAAPECDALLTKSTDLFLAVSTADCFPVLLGEPFAGIVGAVHAGRRGVAEGILECALEACADWGGSIDQVRAWVGPGIGGCCYEVGPEVAEELEPPYRRTGPGGSIRIDLREAIYQKLTSKGVWPRNIIASSYCTACRTDLFFSHRAEGGRTGRMWSLIARPSKPPEPTFEIHYPRSED